jgi:hypothetical protein
MAWPAERRGSAGSCAERRGRRGAALPPPAPGGEAWAGHQPQIFLAARWGIWRSRFRAASGRMRKGRGSERLVAPLCEMCRE